MCGSFSRDICAALYESLPTAPKVPEVEGRRLCFFSVLAAVSLLAYVSNAGRFPQIKEEEKIHIRPSFMGIGFGSGILLDLVLFADRIIAEPKSNRSILWDMEVCNDLDGVCAFF